LRLQNGESVIVHLHSLHSPARSVASAAT
jgi:hypothetical protein